MTVTSGEQINRLCAIAGLTKLNRSAALTVRSVLPDFLQSLRVTPSAVLVESARMTRRA